MDPGERNPGHVHYRGQVKSKEIHTGYIYICREFLPHGYESYIYTKLLYMFFFFFLRYGIQVTVLLFQFGSSCYTRRTPYRCHGDVSPGGDEDGFTKCYREKVTDCRNLR